MTEDTRKRVDTAIRNELINAEASRVRVQANKDAPPRRGFLYSRDGVDALKWTPLVVVIQVHPDAPESLFCAAVWDLAQLQFGHPEAWRFSREVIFPLPTLKGWGRAVVNFNQSDWTEPEARADWRLVDVIDEEEIRRVYRLWHNLVFPKGMS